MPGVLIQRVTRIRPRRADPLFADAATMLKRSVRLALVMIVSGCLPATERDFQMAQTVTEMSDAVNEIRQLSYELHDRVDSLVIVVARRDTVIRQLANLAGVPIPP